MFKTIRKYGGGATARTQDIADFFALENGKYGRAIINNSTLKFILQLEEDDIKTLKYVLDLLLQKYLYSFYLLIYFVMKLCLQIDFLFSFVLHLF